ncbi:MAG: hypothetical protein COS14_12475 [Bacteroidetes bacterium CG02_land_8_20_14_3_00_31_25]|nr:MAG: hypothetical protein COS14_12475 [Bacteroidetes bacterium CG02_land_8_20_14_3_00_31_25]PIX36048.1 MAG: hypothetical protein COZ59_03200 [Bacteroidetes bacterium CG_4_8_14_3_um_filter_31_14]PIY05998.1 MAG: hypothetical protein COZ21_03510 [Bacteroidetes bacterium CG_4_10_14_3_um_filter_31_20]
METKEILKLIKKLPISKRMLVIERTIKTIRESELRKKMIKASEFLLEDYRKDKELTAFTQLDYESFYETR